MTIWIATRPSVSDRWSDVPGIIQDNWAAYGAATSAEHGSLGSTTSGTHGNLGKAGVCFYGTTTEINALASVPSGALAYDSTLGCLKRYWNGAWAPTTSAGWSRARWSLSANTALGDVNGGTQSVGLSFNKKIYDNFSEYTSGDAKWTASGAGYYMVVAQAMMNASADTGTSCAATATSDIQAGFSRPLVKLYGIPTADGTIGDWIKIPSDTPVGSLYTLIDDTFNAEDTSTYLQTSTWTLSAGFPISRPALATNAANISVSIVAKVRSGITTSRASGAIVFNNQSISDWKRIGSTNFNATFNHYWTTAWTENPNTAAAWTEAEVEGTDATNGISGIIFRSGGSGFGNLWVTSCLLSATYDLATNYNYIAEYLAPSDSDYLSTATTDSIHTKTDSYSASGGWLVPAYAQNISASVWVRAYRSSESAISAGSVVRLSNGVAYSGISPTSGAPLCSLDSAGFVTYRFIWNKNPVTNTAWTSGQVNGTTAGQSLTGFGYYLSGTGTPTSAYVSQAFITVDWENPDPTTKLEVWKNYGVSATSAVFARGLIKQPQVGVSRNDVVRALGFTQMLTGDIITCQVTKTLDDDTIMSGDDSTYICVHRMGSSFL